MMIHKSLFVASIGSFVTLLPGFLATVQPVNTFIWCSSSDLFQVDLVVVSVALGGKKERKHKMFRRPEIRVCSEDGLPFHRHTAT
jgi:hypothetical protein